MTRRFDPSVGLTRSFAGALEGPATLNDPGAGGGVGGPRQQGKATFTVNGKGAAKGQVTEDNADVLRQFDLKDHVRAGTLRAPDGPGAIRPRPAD